MLLAEGSTEHKQGGANTASNKFIFDINQLVVISDKHPHVKYKGQTGNVIALTVEGGRKKTKNDHIYTVKLNGKAFNGSEAMFEESFLDFAPSIVEKQKSEKILSMMLGRDTNSDDNDSDVCKSR
jgi:hypothetical protein